MINESTIVVHVREISKFFINLGQQDEALLAGIPKTAELMSVNNSETAEERISWNFSDIGHPGVDGVSGSGANLVSFPGKGIIIPLYTLIFFLSITGNLLVILTLARNRRMRTVTNVYLLNLAISDLLLGVFCVPITLVGQILRNFIFGSHMCKMIPYFQAVAVSVGVYTLVAISLERYFAICRPLRSRKWQTKSHAYKIITMVWCLALGWNLPILFVSELRPIRNTGRFKCREMWPNSSGEKTFNLFLDLILLVIPLCIMGMAYSLIVTKLWKGMRNEILHTRSFYQAGKPTSPAQDAQEPSMELSSHNSHSHYSICKAGNSVNGDAHGNSVWREGASGEVMTYRNGKGVVVRWQKKNATVEKIDVSGARKASPENAQFLQGQPKRLAFREMAVHQSSGGGGGYLGSGLAPYGKSRTIRSTYTGKSIESKKKVIRMLFVLVAEFFLAWTPLYVMNTWYLFNPEAVYHIIGPVGVSLIQLLAYTSSCCNPITYCFMNRKFRQAFLKVFQIGLAPRKPPIIVRASEPSGNDSIIYGLQGTLLNKSVVLEREERV